MKNILVIVLFLIFQSPGWAEEGPPSSEMVVPTVRRQIDPERISLSIESADLRAVVTALADSHDINLVGSDKLAGVAVTIHLSNAPVTEALRIILGNAGFELVTRDNGIYEILTREDALKTREGTSTQMRVFQLKFTDVNAVAKLLVPNAITDAKNIAVEPISRQLILSGTEEQFKKVQQIIDAVDKPVTQVMIQARIVEIDTEKALSFGFSIQNDLGINGEENGNIGFDLLQAPIDKATLAVDYSTEKIDAKLRALAQNKVAEVLSAPQITTSQGLKAEIKVTNEVPIVTRTTRIIDSTTVTDETVTFKDTGLILTVTPRVLDGNRIDMTIEPSVLVLTGYTETEPSEPIIDTRSAKTQVIVNDGRWVVIGGLMRYNEKIVVRGIPILKDIPLLGWLFRTTDKQRVKSNLVIFVSGSVMTPEKTDKAAAGEMDTLRKDRIGNPPIKIEGGPFPSTTPDDSKTPPQSGGE